MRIFLIHLTIIFILLLVIYGSAQEQQTKDEQPSQSFFFYSHTVFMEKNTTKIDGENGTIIESGDLSFKSAKVLDVVQFQGQKGVIMLYGLSGSGGNTQISTKSESKKTIELGKSTVIDGQNLTYVGKANGSLGTYHIYSIQGQYIAVDYPTTMNINGNTYTMMAVNNNLVISKVENQQQSMQLALIVEIMLGIVAGGLIIWMKKTGSGLFSHS